MRRLAWDTDNAIAFPKETNTAAMILEKCMWKSKDWLQGTYQIDAALWSDVKAALYNIMF